MWRVWGRGEAYTGIDGRIILKWIFKKLDVGEWNGPSWLRIGIGGGHV
jgi:hypothetical protein